MKRSGEASSSGNKLERKTIEKNRRIMMKGLCFKLVSLIPDHHFNPPKESLSQNDQIEQAASYIALLKERVEELKRKKASLGANPKDGSVNTGGSEIMPVFNVRDLGSHLEINLITGQSRKLMLHKVIRILEQQGTEVVTVSTSSIGHKIFHTLRAQVKVPRIGVDTARIGELISYVL